MQFARLRPFSTIDSNIVSYLCLEEGKKNPQKQTPYFSLIRFHRRFSQNTQVVENY